MLNKEKVVPHSEWAYPILHVHLFMQRHVIYCMYQKKKLPGFTKSKIVTCWLILLTLCKLNMKIINMYISPVQSCPTLYDLKDCSMPVFQSIIHSRSLFKLMSIESVMPSTHLIFCHPPVLLPSIFPSIRDFSNESVLCIRWSKY